MIYPRRVPIAGNPADTGLGPWQAAVNTLCTTRMQINSQSHNKMDMKTESSSATRGPGSSLRQLVLLLELSHRQIHSMMVTLVSSKMGVWTDSDKRRCCNRICRR